MHDSGDQRLNQSVVCQIYDSVFLSVPVFILRHAFSNHVFQIVFTFVKKLGPPIPFLTYIINLGALPLIGDLSQRLISAVHLLLPKICLKLSCGVVLHPTLGGPYSNGNC